MSAPRAVPGGRVPAPAVPAGPPSAAAPPPPAGAAPDGLPPPQRRRAVAVLILGLALAVLDGAIVNLALPVIVRDLDAGAVQAVWVVTAYQVATLVLLLPCAMLGDLVGHRRVYLGGLLVFTLASLACALSTSLAALIASRAVQGLGAAGLMSVNTALVRLVYPKRLLGRGIAINSMVVATSAVAGPSIAAVLLSVAHWPWLFAVNLPLGAAVLLLGPRVLPDNAAAPPRPAGSRLAPLDVLLNAAMFAGVFLGADAVGTHLAGSRAHGAGGVGLELGLGALALGLAAGVVHVRRQRALALPLLPIDLLRIPVFGLSMCTSVAAFAAQTLAYVALPFLLLEGLGRDHARTGLLMTAWPLATVVAAPLAGRLIGRVPDGLLGAAGLAAMACGLAALAALPAAPDDLAIAWRMALCGAGFGLFQSPNNHTIVTSAPLHRAGAASGMLGTARLTGQAAGAVLLAVVFSAAGAGQRRGTALALGLAAAFALAAAAFSALRLRTARPPA